MTWTCPECGSDNHNDISKCFCGYDGNVRSRAPLVSSSTARSHDLPSVSKDIRAERDKYKTFWRRFWAGCVDGLVLLPLTLIQPWEYSQYIPNFLYILWFILHEASWYFYSILMHGRFGQTLGKMVFRVKVIDETEKKPITYRQAFMRDSIMAVIFLIFVFVAIPELLQGKNPYELKDGKQILSYFLWQQLITIWFVAEVITMLTNKKRRALHDFIARSVVVKIPRKKQA